MAANAEWIGLAWTSRRDRFDYIEPQTLDVLEIIVQPPDSWCVHFARIIAGNVRTCNLGFGHLTGKEQLEQ